MSNDIEYSSALIYLLKGAVSRETRPRDWETVLINQFKIREYIKTIGLELVINENDGYCYLVQVVNDDENSLPRLVPRHQLSYPISVLLVILRKKMQEFDKQSNDGRYILSKEEIINQMKLFFPVTTNEAKSITNIIKYINRVVELGFLRELKSSDDKYEVLRITRSFIDANWLNQLDEKLEEYQKYSFEE